MRTLTTGLGVVALATAAAASAVPAWAADPPPGATACSGCHAPAGSGGFMPVDGRPAAELVAQMDAFRSGAQPSTVMGRIMKGFSQPEIDAIAAWLASRPQE